MHLHRYFLIGVLTAAAAACGRDTNGVTTPTPPLAYVRYVNAINDTKPVDFRMVDSIQHSPSFFGQTNNGAKFREVSPYQATGPGSRDVRVFWDDTIPANATTVVADAKLDFAANKYYTVVVTGSSVGANTGKLAVITDDMSAISPDKVLVRAYNLAPALGKVDILTDTTTGTALFKGLTPGTPASVSVPVATAAMYFAATATGTTTPVLAAADAPMGDNDPTVPVAGLGLGGSDVTVIVMPSGGSFTTAGLAFGVHWLPPSGAAQ
ncbi:MAG TPA: DUF4397 domain-containing protein [Gemmatimonadaceae bacterium]|nr:DUF4397 domain-containing protein [Gemmatimonadaceae bacterium]